MTENKNSIGIIYRNRFVYRAAMNTLYAGKYRDRFRLIVPYLGNVKSVLELCFGDTVFAELCKKRNVSWTGIDNNEMFVNKALKNRYHALCENILEMKEFPSSDCVVMTGSLYQFHSATNELFAKIFSCTSKLILSEPIRNLSSRKDVIGRMASRYSKTKDGIQPFRYDQKSLTEEISRLADKFAFSWKTYPADRDSIIVINK
ncbi:MAG: hypothetical protein V2A54_09365 [Bacteroidota bacterium]